MQTEAYELTRAGCVLPFPNQADMFVCLVNRTNVNVQRMANGGWSKCCIFMWLACFITQNFGIETDTVQFNKE